MKKQILSKLVMIMVLIGLIITIFLAFQTRNTTIQYSLKKAEAITDVVKSGLTAHMVNNTMDQRQTFLNSISNTSGIDKIWVIRGNNIIKQYGETKFKQDNFHDDIDMKVIQSGDMHYNITENLSQAKLRITIPYKAISDGAINCLECHNVKYGETLGAISLELNISDFKDQGIINSMIVLSITIFGIIVLLFLINKIIRPYIKTLELLKTKIEHASNGEFKEITIASLGIKKDAQEIIDLIDTYNKLTKSLMKTFTEIDEKLKVFVGKINNNICSTNPLMDAADIVTNLSYIYQFKKEVQSDRDTREIYARLGSVFKNQFGVKYLNIIEVYNNIKVVKAYEHGEKDFCFHAIVDDCNNCRALRTGECTSGIDFQTTCSSFNNEEFNYLCMEMEAGRGTNVIFNFLFASLEELKDFQISKPFVENYIKEAMPEIEMKILLKALEDASLRDGLTGLYNRRFFDEHMKKLIPQVKRNGQQLAFMMLDIDHFKAVNDEYGHDIGDKVLVESAHIIANNVRESDLVIRFGGEEFIVILVDIASEEDAYNVAMKLKNKIAENEIDVYAGSTIRKTTSVGFSMFPKDSFSLTTVMKYADMALYEAKENGRNQVKRYSKNEKEDEVELF